MSLQPRCSSCDAIDKPHKKLRKCTNCNGLVYYCSKACQKAEWKTHKIVCKIAKHIPPDATILKIDPDNFEHDYGIKSKDLDTVLSYASKYMTNLRHAEIKLPRPDDDDDQDALVVNKNGGDTVATTRQKKVATRLKQFLETHNLLSLEIDNSCGRRDQTRGVLTTTIDDDDALAPLEHNPELRSLRVANVRFDDVSRVTSLLSGGGKRLRVLELDGLSFRRRRRHHKTSSAEVGVDDDGSASRRGGWSREECHGLTKAILSHARLVKLSLDGCFLTDDDLTRLLLSSSTEEEAEGSCGAAGVSCLSELRSLSLSGPDDGDNDGSGGGYITDKGLEAIASSCPRLQSLVLCHQRRATADGIASVLKKCRHLREIHVSVFIDVEKSLPRLLAVSKTLLLFYFEDDRLNDGTAATTVVPASNEALTRAVVASGGRTILASVWRGLIEVEGLEGVCYEEAGKSRRLVEETRRKLGDPTVYNEWEWLF